MFAKLRSLWPNPGLARSLMFGLSLVGLLVGAYCLGRHGGLSSARAQDRRTLISDFNPVQANHPTGDTEYDKRVVGYVYGNIPITRAELGEYLIARMGSERLELLINRKILEIECQKKGISITDAEVNNQIRQDVAALGGGISVAEFEKQVLNRFKKTMFEWKEDVVRPKLALERLATPLVQVTFEDLEKSFEANYGEKVQCRMIVLPREERNKWTLVYSQVKASEAGFDDVARKQFIPDLAARGGEVPPVHKNFPDKTIEKEAFSLQPGQISRLLEMPDGTAVILRCEKFLSRDPLAKFEDKRVELDKQMRQLKLTAKMQELFLQLRNQAQPLNLLQTTIRQNDLERAVHQELNPTRPSPSTTNVTPVSATLPQPPSLTPNQPISPPPALENPFGPPGKK